MSHAYPKLFDVVVIGGGHAGCEAAHAAARLGCETLLLTLTLDGIGQMSCNPSVGGQAKSQLAKEVDALGGLLARVTDCAGIQYRSLNQSKGPAVKCTRVQCDTALFRSAMLQALFETPKLQLAQGRAISIRPQAKGGFLVHADLGLHYVASAVVLCTGTFLRGLCHIGEVQFAAGRFGEPAATELGQSLEALGIQLGRHKTGTPARLDGRSIDWSKLEAQSCDSHPPPMSFYGDAPRLEQRACYIGYTQPQTHALIAAARDRSPLFSGVIQGIGPRYCPSIEDKVFRFADKERHQLFLEPMGLRTQEIYPAGLSTSLPVDVQFAYLRSIPGLENVEMLRPGYAVEYDYVRGGQLEPSLALRAIPGLFAAGQLNGTSGYEEAAAQGLLAGVNAARFVRGQDPVVVSREQAYLGVMVDDLVNHESAEPYRLFSSRAEFRLLLREDNADRRVSPLGRQLGLLDERAWARFEAKAQACAALRAELEARTVAPSEFAAQYGERFAGLKNRSSLAQLCCRPELSWEHLYPFAESLASYSETVRETVLNDLRLQGYVARQEQFVARFRQLESMLLPEDLDYAQVAGLSAEAQQRLSRVRPRSLGQASRLEGVTPASVNAILIHLRKRQAKLGPKRSGQEGHVDDEHQTSEDGERNEQNGDD
ncbi:MAG: tRNA uridine-5-carboxymethylaminomethyl(34) synthesis enzyme MnmG [Myxococcota bacterium]|nr:tRNA uridine-5-carboxymethylaminomethyl(34) synthesis enzyme MnmG [Myxococcota bacterium]